MDIVEIEKEITNLKEGETNWQNIQRLSWLYTVYDHLLGRNTRSQVVSQAENTEIRCVMPDCTGEFGEIVSGVNIYGLMNILSEHMSVIKILHPKEYQAVIDRIREIP